MQQQSLRKKFILIVGGAISLLLLVTAIIAVSHFSTMTRQNIETEITKQVEYEAQSVASFFSRYGAVAKTFVNNPFLQKFFSQHHQRGARDIENLDTLTAMFNGISGTDTNIKSAFFASANTGEYFYEPGPIGVDTEGEHAWDPAFGYFANKRPWFQSALDHGNLYVSPPAVDSQDGSVSAVVQSPIYKDGKLIGVGGVDILISTIGKRVDDIHYHNEGTAFLLDEEQNIVYFPEKQKSLELSQPFADFDQHFSDTSGFRALSRQIASTEEGMVNVTWKGEQYIAVFKRASLRDPKMEWTLGMLIPQALIDAPIHDTIVTYALVSLLIILIITTVTWLAVTRLTRPLVTLREALTDIASGSGDLTKRLAVESSDEIGQLAEQFNLFTDKLHRLLSQAAENTEEVAKAADQLRDVSSNTNQEIQQELSQVASVTTAVTEMAATVVEISQNASTASDAASEVEAQVAQGAEQAKEAMREITGLSTSINQAVEVVSGLSKESENIGAVIDVITSIAEQTNLLALNAAIEAARAGEQGRGFAVVADEVRSLASRTRESTDDILRMVERLQAMARQTDSVMQEGHAKTQQGVTVTQQVLDSLTSIRESIRTVQEQNSHIAVATDQQKVAAESINESMVAITDSSESTASHADQLAGEASRLSSVANTLKGVIRQFKL